MGRSRRGGSGWGGGVAGAGGSPGRGRERGWERGDRRPEAESRPRGRRAPATFWGGEPGSRAARARGGRREDASALARGTRRARRRVGRAGGRRGARKAEASGPDGPNLRRETAVLFDTPGLRVLILPYRVFLGSLLHLNGAHALRHLLCRSLVGDRRAATSAGDPGCGRGIHTDPATYSTFSDGPDLKHMLNS